MRRSLVPDHRIDQPDGQANAKYDASQQATSPDPDGFLLAERTGEPLPFGRAMDEPLAVAHRDRT